MVELSVKEKTSELLSKLGKRWMVYCFALRVLHTVLLLFGIIGSIAAPVLIAQQPSHAELAMVVSTTAAISFAIISTFKMDQKANQLRRGWAVVFIALMRYENSTIGID